jgi:hypothetical protein
MEVKLDSDGIVWTYSPEEQRAAESWNKGDWYERVAEFLEAAQKIDPSKNYIIIDNLDPQGRIIGAQAVECAARVIETADIPTPRPNPVLFSRRFLARCMGRAEPVTLPEDHLSGVF